MSSNSSRDYIETNVFVSLSLFFTKHALTKLIKGAKAILCTLNTAGSVFLRKTVGDNFDTLFLDEAAQVRHASMVRCIAKQYRNN